jgi:NitT/TauT family transport system permease protein/sulfonate transport system permease protein
MNDAAPNRSAAHGLAEGAILAFVLLWWWTSRGLPAFVLPGPAEVAATLARFAVDPNLFWHLAVSFLRVSAAVLIAMALALALGLLARASRTAAAVIEKRVLLILNSFPSVGWAILGVVWFQVSNATVIFIEVAILLPFCLVNVLEGFRQIDAELEEMGRSFTRSPTRLFLRVTLPLVAPYLVAGLRVATGIGWKIALVAELFGAQSGLGFLLVQAQSTANAAMVFAVCFVIVGVVFLIDRALLRPLAQRFSRNQGGSS